MFNCGFPPAKDESHTKNRVPEADDFRDFFVEIACCCETAKNNYLCSLNGLSINRIIV